MSPNDNISEMDNMTESDSERPVAIEERLLSRIRVREQGLPTLAMPGQICRSAERQTVSCMVACEDQAKVQIETRPLVVLPIGELSWLPNHWRTAMWEYVQAWPLSGCGLGPLLAISRAERHSLLCKLAHDLLATDEIGAPGFAHAMGLLAALEFERPKE